MTIPTKKEPPDMYENTKVLERCYFCGYGTFYWHENTNNPCCQRCAKVHKVAELPDHGKKIRAQKRKLAKQRTSRD